jgi:transcriptional regulator with XRE-family HTH domain
VRHDRVPEEGIDLGPVLRALRHQADYSQRDLACRAGVPPATLARVESGANLDPRFRTVERLVQAAGSALVIPAPEPDRWRERLTDAADRRYPAHLDVRAVDDLRDWWRYWFDYYIPRTHWPKGVPDYTYDLSRKRRDRRRENGPPYQDY